MQSHTEEELRRRQRIKDMEEEGMSDDEIKKTLEQKEFFQFKKEMAKIGE
jgi:DNA-binding transcriptional MerR regulator